MAPKRVSKSSNADKKSSKAAKDNKKTTDSAKKNVKNEKGEKGGCSSSTDQSKMTLCTYPMVGARSHQVRERRPGRPPSGKRLSMMREMPAKVRSAFRRSLDPCDNSNDSGLGFDHHTDQQQMAMADRVTWSGERAEVKRPRMDIKTEQEDFNDRYAFPPDSRSCKENNTLIRTAPSGSVPSLNMNNNQGSAAGRAVPRCIPLSNRPSASLPVSLTTQLSSSSRYKDVSLTIVKQPEQQHRARYQTEGSRGAVKDRDGNGFPIVQLTGYYQPTTLQVFIGTDVGKVAPHMFYQACKVSGKNSTPCVEKKIDGTCVIELQLDPSKEMSATCDCVGILKERNVDVEHRFPEQLGNRSKKKSTRCRMIFRTTLIHEDGSQEILQVCSQPIVCTQPPGVPEISKKSLTSCPASGGLELFVLGKNFLKDTRIYFQQVGSDDRQVQWEQTVIPDKEYLQQTHFVCVIPPYHRPDITEPVTVRLCVVSSGKTSEPHQFVYTPVNGAVPSVHGDQSSASQGPFFNKILWSSSVNKREQDLGMMPPPESSMVPLATRRPSLSVPSTSEVHSPPLRTLKQEYVDENSQNSMIDSMDVHQERYRHISESSLDVHHGDSNMSMINDNSMDIMNHNHNSMLSHNDNSNESSTGLMRRRNSMSNSMDVNLGNSRMSVTNEDSSCSPSMHCSNSVVTDRLVLAQSSLLRKNLMTSATHSTPTAEELKVMDLRTKMPMATVADLVNSSAPSMATLQSFGMTEASNVSLPAQSAQSIENFLTNIESKPNGLMVNIPNQAEMQLKNAVQEMICSPKLLGPRNLLVPATAPTLTESEPVFLSSQRPFLSSANQNEAMQIVAKSEAAAVAEQTVPEQTNTMAPSITTISTMSATLENSIATTINTDRLDALVNSTVESHIGSPTRSDPSKDMLLSNKLTMLPTNTGANQSDMLLTSGDVMLNSRSSLMVPPMINTTLSSSPILSQQDLNHNSTNLSPEVILNSQISPSMMCRNTQDGLVSICQSSANVEQTLLPISQQPPVPSPNNMSTLHSPIAVNNMALVGHSEAEKVVLFKAAVDLLETQKKLSELDHNMSPTKPLDAVKEPIITNIVDNIITMSQTTNTDVMSGNSRLSQLPGNNFVQSSFTNSTTASGSIMSNNMMLSKTMTPDSKSDFVIPVPVKEITGVSQSDKKNEDRMIPQSFTSLTENELINLINPSCFDQV